jgi:hypothetical protein
MVEQHLVHLVLLLEVAAEVEQPQQDLMEVLTKIQQVLVELELHLQLTEHQQQELVEVVEEIMILQEHNLKEEQVGVVMEDLKVRLHLQQEQLTLVVAVVEQQHVILQLQLAEKEL